MKQIFIVIVILLLGLAACGGKEDGSVSEDELAMPTTASETSETVETAVGEVETANETEETAVNDTTTENIAETSNSSGPMVTAVVNLNVRSGPGTQYPVVDSMAANTQAPIIGKNSDGSWWKIICPSGATTECWTSAGTQYSTAINADSIPVVTAPPLPVETAVSHPTATPQHAATATTDASIPTNTPAHTPTPTVEATATVDTSVPTSTATVDANVPTSNDDGDSADHPSTSFIFNFNQGGVGQITRQRGDAISYPMGDNEDWIELRPQADAGSVAIDMGLTCSDSYENSDQAIRATIWENGNERPDLQVRCNGVSIGMPLVGNRTYLIRIHFEGEGPYYSRYSLTLDNARIN